MKTIHHLDMSKFLESYTAQVNAEYQRSKDIREGRIPAPNRNVQANWNISDRH